MQLKILSVCTEFAPLVKVGGLADVTSGLARYLTGQSHEVVTLLPRTGAANGITYATPLETGVLSAGDHPAAYSFARVEDPEAGSIVFLDCPEFFGKDTYSGGPREGEAFLLLSSAVIELCRHLNWYPDILHCHDWHTALAPCLISNLPEFADTRTVLTIHNIGYQGVFKIGSLRDFVRVSGKDNCLPDSLKPDEEVNFLSYGITCANRVTTVSPTHAEEICTDEYGMGLQSALLSKDPAPVGVLNGVDYSIWDPSTDSFIASNFGQDSIDDKERNKTALCRELALEEPRMPLLGMVSRLVYQKGIDLVAAALPELLSRHNLLCVILGEGDPDYVAAIDAIAQQFPLNIRFIQGYDEALAHRIYASADMLVIPSRYEPCGLTQLYALRYGTVPVVRSTGGLKDSVEHFDPESGRGNGVVFEHADVGGLVWGLETALNWYTDRSLWRHLQLNGMQADFAWSSQGKIYEDLYLSLVGTASGD